MVETPSDTPPEKGDVFPFPGGSIANGFFGVGLCLLALLSARILCRLNPCMSCACCHSFCDFINVSNFLKLI